jgi:hypothetical protein
VHRATKHQSGDCALILEGHGVAEVVVTVGNPTAVEADVLRVLRQFFDFVKLVIAGKNTQMSLVIALTLYLFHCGPTIPVSPEKFNPRNRWAGQPINRLSWTRQQQSCYLVE